jgi:hypothetical protein
VNKYYLHSNPTIPEYPTSPSPLLIFPNFPFIHIVVVVSTLHFPTKALKKKGRKMKEIVCRSVLDVNGVAKYSPFIAQ